MRSVRAWPSTFALVLDSLKLFFRPADAWHLEQPAAASYSQPGDTPRDLIVNESTAMNGDSAKSRLR
jgi:hypothetical protein